MSKEAKRLWKSTLFSEYYLLERAPRESSGATLFKKAKQIWNDQRNLVGKYNEAQLEEHFIKPMLELLGHVVEVQETTEAHRIPDYAFFATNEDRKEAIISKEISYSFYEKVIGVGDAKAWNKPLDKRLGTEPRFDFQNPSFQIDVYLRQTRCRWGILTNGKIWRLYCRDTSYRLDSFVEFELPIILDLGVQNDFDLFYSLFRREAFEPDKSGFCYLDKLKDESLRFAIDLGDRLQENLFQALRILAEGFFLWKDNNLSPDSATLQKVYESSIRFLYRLLFILFAESRGLLPLDNKIYRDQFSIEAIIRAAELENSSISTTKYKSIYSQHLKYLFQLIDSGNEGINIPSEEMFVPPYNGSLFDPEEDLFLKIKEIGDFYLVQTIRLLATAQVDGRRIRIDYGTLEIRHLGALYEILLECKLEVAAEDLCQIERRGKRLLLPLRKFSKRRGKLLSKIPKGSIVVTGDPTERKLFGAYYTPDPIVRFITERTLGPLVEERIDRAIQNGDDPVSAILSLRVLDPAMGSGHFLVEAANFLANKVIEHLVTAEEDSEEDITWARREVVRQCLYGVDLKPLATELAKLSLWLATVSKGKPLSFLDHHLKTGNSLIGATLEDFLSIPREEKDDIEEGPLDRYFAQAETKELPLLSQKYRELADQPDDKVRTIHWKEDAFTSLQRSRAYVLLKSLAHLRVAQLTGYSDPSEQQFKDLLDKIDTGKKDLDLERPETWFEPAQKLMEDVKVFHWQLEFPDVLLGEDSGFDAIIGNPPYVFSREGKVDSEWKDYYFKSFVTLKDKPNTYIMFVERSCSLLTDGGRLGFILPNSWLGIPSGEPLRMSILKQMEIDAIVSFFGQVFEGIDVENVILVASKRTQQANPASIFIVDAQKGVSSIPDEPTHFLQPSIWEEDPGTQFSIYTRDEDRNILEKIRSCSVNLGDITDVRSGLQAYEQGKGNPPQTREDVKNHVFDRDHKEDDSTYPYLDPGDIQRYHIQWGGKWLKWGPWLSQPRNLMIFSKPRILIREITGRYPKSLLCAYTEEILLNNKSVLNVVEKDGSKYNLHYILALLNSKLMSFVFRHTAVKAMRTMFPKVIIEDVRRFPIAIVTKEQQKELSELIKSRTKAQIELQNAISSFVDWVIANGWTDRRSEVLLNFYCHSMETVSKRLRGVKSSVKAFTTFKKEYTTWAEKCRNLAKINESLDDEIDKRVFQLYGLTEEDIAILADQLGSNF